MAAFADTLDLQLNGLFPESLQGDAVLTEMMENFGIRSEFNEKGVRLSKSGQPPKPFFEKDFVQCPDLAQTMAVVCGGLGVQGLFSGLETLKIKETDRVAALRTELDKVGVWVSKLPSRFSKKSDKTYYTIEGKASVKDCPVFKTWEDHRMAMCMAPLSMFGAIKIADPEVVGKSYPAFWKDIQSLGFEVLSD
ncbi:MAG: 3-phosphoshikimate 1-carboxyvinyltransferase, partial [Bacteroidetes bacterium]